MVKISNRQYREMILFLLDIKHPEIKSRGGKGFQVRIDPEKAKTTIFPYICENCSYGFFKNPIKFINVACKIELPFCTKKCKKEYIKNLTGMAVI